MSEEAPRTSVFAWRRHPLLWAQWLASRNAVRRFFQDGRRATLVLAIGGIGVLAACAGLLMSPVRTVRAFRLLSEYRGLVAVSMGLYAALASNSRRPWVEEQHARSWLSATPISPGKVHLSVTLVGTLPLIGRCLAGGAMVVMLGLFAHQPLDAIVGLVTLCVGGMFAGVVTGWWLPRFFRSRESDDARYLAAPARIGSSTPSLDALAAWPLAQTRTWSRPENARLILIAALFAVQGGSSAFHGLCVVATWLIAAYLSGLLAALVRSGQEAAQWLRTTPISFARFAWPLARRVLLRQAILTVVASVGLLELGATLDLALYFGALWLTVVLLVTSLSLADSYRGRAPGLKLFLSLSALVGVESRQQGWSIPLALVLVAWHLRRRTYA